MKDCCSLLFTVPYFIMTVFVCVFGFPQKTQRLTSYERLESSKTQFFSSFNGYFVNILYHGVSGGLFRHIVFYHGEGEGTVSLFCFFFDVFGFSIVFSTDCSMCVPLRIAVRTEAFRSSPRPTRVSNLTSSTLDVFWSYPSAAQHISWTSLSLID